MLTNRTTNQNLDFLFISDEEEAIVENEKVNVANQENVLEAQAVLAPNAHDNLQPNLVPNNVADVAEVDLQCPECKSDFSSKGTRDRHVRTVHGRILDENFCHACDRGFNRRSSYLRHNKTIETLVRRVAMCKGKRNKRKKFL